MYLIVGLGNPGKKYDNTFHNSGFLAIDELADRLDVSFGKKITCKAVLAEGFVGGEKVILAKPQTYMNLSGESVRELVAYYKLPLSNLMVFYDDYDLPLGAL
ncbi:MAG: peptidyl-tRNA hydrolase, partial [Clostridia bacterium]|nr:peptidyl-tRNA hydrolase [Clostridia bacterium]